MKFCNIETADTKIQSDLIEDARVPPSPWMNDISKRTPSSSTTINLYIPRHRTYYNGRALCIPCSPLLRPFLWFTVARIQILADTNYALTPGGCCTYPELATHSRGWCSLFWCRSIIPGPKFDYIMFFRQFVKTKTMMRRFWQDGSCGHQSSVVFEFQFWYNCRSIFRRVFYACFIVVGCLYIAFIWILFNMRLEITVLQAIVVKAFEFIYIHFHILDIVNFSRFSWRSAFLNVELIRNNLTALMYFFPTTPSSSKARIYRNVCILSPLSSRHRFDLNLRLFPYKLFYLFSGLFISLICTIATVHRRSMYNNKRFSLLFFFPLFIVTCMFAQLLLLCRLCNSLKKMFIFFQFHVREENCHLACYCVFHDSDDVL